MLKNYFRVAIRNFLRDKLFTIINLAGLAISLTCVCIILAYLNYELSFDKHYSNSPRIYRLISERTKGNDNEKSVSLPEPLATTLKKEFPEIELVTLLEKSEGQFLIHDEPMKLNTIVTNNNFLNIFNLPFIRGNREMALTEDNSIVLTEKIAHTLFPGQNPIGTYLNSKVYNGNIVPFKITGIIKDIPGNTHFKAEAIIGHMFKPEGLDWNMYAGRVQYILLKKNTSADALQKKFSSIYKKYNFPDNLRIALQPVESIHLHSNISYEPYANSSIKYIYIFLFTAILILTIACINYINLTTSRSFKRVREIGVRKVVGAERKQLIFQFTIESVLFFCTTLPVIFFLSNLLWPLFMKVVNIEAPDNYLVDKKFFIGIAGISLLTGALSGFYPAFFLSKLRPAHILKDWQKGLKLNLDIRKGLIVFQFVISVSLIIATMVIYSQLHLLNNMELGFNKNYLITLPWKLFGNKTEAFKHELKENKNIMGVTVSGWKAGDYYSSYSKIVDPGDTTKELKVASVFADYDFLKTMQVPLVRGRDFSRDFAADDFNTDSLFSVLGKKKLSNEEIQNLLSSQSVILTESTAKALQLKEPVTGQVLKYRGLRGTVIGEVKNFLGISLLQQPPLVVLTSDATTSAGYTYIRVLPGDVSGTIAFIQNTWKKFFPQDQFEFSFVDDRLKQSYDSQTRLASIFNSFALLAIIIATLGLFSLVALTVQQKTKEIGIRKVLGASVMELVRLLSKEFFDLVFIAILIASPLAWWAMHKWLEDFNYRIAIGWWIFVIAGIGCMCFTISVVAVQAAKAARANPVKSLRTE